MIPLNSEFPSQQLNDVLFDVSLEPLFSKFQLQNKYPVEQTVSQYKAVVNKKSGQILSVVSKNYELIKNKEALEMGKIVFKQLYPKVDVNELVPFKVVFPKSLTSANIDLIHKDVNFDMWEQEKWLPFLRISNSYNRTHALSFEIGFVKELCSNGVLFNKQTLKLKYFHDKSRKINLKNDSKEIASVAKQFGEQCNRLLEYKVPQEDMFPLLCLILKINLQVPDERQVNTKTKNLEKLKKIVSEQMAAYEKSYGLSAYNAFNIATDIVSHNDKYKALPGYYFNIRSFFIRPTVWTEEFSGEIVKSDFSLNDYLKPTIKELNDFNEITGFKWN